MVLFTNENMNGTPKANYNIYECVNISGKQLIVPIFWSTDAKEFLDNQNEIYPSIWLFECIE